MTNEVSERVYIGLVRRPALREYAIYLVNNSDVAYERVVSFTGMFASVDDSLLDSSRAGHDWGPLAPRVAMMLEDGDANDLDFIIWYWIDLYVSSKDDPVKLWFQTHKGLAVNPGTSLPLLAEPGYVLGLQTRRNRNGEESSERI